MSKLADRAAAYFIETLPLLDPIDADFWRVHLAQFAAQEVARTKAELRRIWSHGTNAEFNAATRSERPARKSSEQRAERLAVESAHAAAAAGIKRAEKLVERAKAAKKGKG